MIWDGTFFMIGTDWQRTFKTTKDFYFTALGSITVTKTKFSYFILIFLQCLIAPETFLRIHTLGKQKKDTGAP